MASAREAAMAALTELLRGTGAQVWRATDLPREVPPTGLIMLAEGDASEIPLLSPLRWEIEQHAVVDVTVVADDEIDRDAALDALLAQIAAAIAADRTLAGTVDWAEPLSPATVPMEIDGAGKTARLVVVLSFVAQDTVLGPRAT